ncbi:sensor histidine kinase [Salinimicrobium gaetbulicola]|uniref:histidine kinase n=1 Tax=Salinimicrobium gaetbulicola TaxID=999702 RepID=A0ABW3IGE0_9FLAO
MKNAAQYIRDHNEEIIEEWENTVKKEIEASRETNSLALRNQLPHVLSDIAEIMERYNDFEEVKNNEKFEEIINNSIDHGRHRASSSAYDVGQILQELIVFHRVITENLRQHNHYNIEVGILLKYTLETAMFNTAKSFSNSLQAMREKLTGTLAHDIKNPISAAYLGINSLSYEDGPERFEKIKKLTLRSLKHSMELIEGLLDSISLKAGDGITFNFEDTDLMTDVTWVFNEASEIYSNDITLETTQKVIRGVFDGTAIRRVLENLVTNAIKHGAKNTPVKIKVDQAGDLVNIRVYNEGKPIPEERQKDIFKFLNSADQEKGELKSWGMGLSLVKIVAEAHGGNVSVESNDEGTSFIIILNKASNHPGKKKSKLSYEEQAN